MQGPSDSPKQGAFVGSAGVVLSALAHVGTFALLGMVHESDVRPPSRPALEFSVVAEPPPAAQPSEPAPEPTPEPEVAPPAPPPPAPKVARVPKPSAVTPPPPDKPPEPTKPPAPAEETLADFSGTTLTSDSPGGWASAVGSGAPMNGPIGKAGATVTGRDVSGVAGGVVGGTGTGTAPVRIVGPGDLSRAAEQPDQDVLNAALERNYPKAARLQGIEGSSKIKLRILASGKPEPVATVSETYPGFAEACRNTLRSMRFKPALDRAGQPVATEIVFPCTFSVE